MYYFDVAYHLGNKPIIIIMSQEASRGISWTAPFSVYCVLYPFSVKYIQILDSQPKYYEYEYMYTYNALYIIWAC